MLPDVRHNPPKGEQDTGVGRLAQVSQGVGSFLRTPSPWNKQRIEHCFSFMHDLVNFQVNEKAHSIGMREYQLPVSAARWQHWSHICFETFIL
jgi:hypothetical protein